MKILILTLLLTFSFSFAKQKETKKENNTKATTTRKEVPKKDHIPTGFLLAPEAEQTNPKGKYYFNKEKCIYALKWNNFFVSTEDNDFRVTFPDGRSAIGKISDAKPGARACWHSLPTRKEGGYYIWFNGTNDLPGDTVSDNCIHRKNDEVVSNLLVLSPVEYNENCKKGDCRSFHNLLTVKAGLGLTYNNGTNLKTKEIQLPSPDYLKENCVDKNQDRANAKRIDRPIETPAQVK